MGDDVTTVSKSPTIKSYCCFGGDIGHGRIIIVVVIAWMRTKDSEVMIVVNFPSGHSVTWFLLILFVGACCC